MAKKYIYIMLSFVMGMNFTFASDESIVHLPTGRHVIADLEQCFQCSYKDGIEEILLHAAQEAGATVLDIKIIPFSALLVDGTMQQGMTGTVILSESHIAFHTWPEYGFVACDIFTCGMNALPEKALQVLLEYFAPKKTTVRVIGRGLASGNDSYTKSCN